MKLNHMFSDRRHRSLVALCGAATVLMSATSALCAADVSDEVKIKVQATIAPRCGFASEPTDPTGKPKVDETTAIVVPFELDCNMPFRIAVQSTYGALRHLGIEDGTEVHSSGFAVTKAYDVGLALGTNASTLVPVDCRSDQLRVGSRSNRCAFFGTAPGEGFSSVNDISVDRPSSLTIKWSGADAGPRHLAGDYQDTLTIFVGPQT